MKIAYLLTAALPLLLLYMHALPQEPVHQPPIPVHQPPIVVNALEEVHVTGDCRIYQKNTPQKKPRFFRDPGICHQESAKHVVEPEDTIVNGTVVKIVYEINESDYLLHNFLDHPVAFVLDQRLPKGWQVITDPQPIETTNKLAIYHVYVQPGQTVRLHTGQRRKRR